MNLAVLLPARITDDNGTTQRAKMVADVLSREYEVTVIASRLGSFDNLSTVLRESILHLLKLAFILPKKPYDRIYCCSDWFGFLSPYLLSKLLRYKIIFEAHGIPSKENRAKNRTRVVIGACEVIERFVISRADYVIACSQDIANYCKAYNKNVELIPVFVDAGQFAQHELRQSRSKVIGLVGPFDMPANKGFLNFLYENLANFDPRIRFKIVGTCRDRIEHEHVSYTGYLPSREAYIRELCSVDALLVPSELATSGPLTKILEAMACGLPVFTTPTGVPGADYVESGKNVLVYEADELVFHTNREIFDDDLLATVGANARRLIEERYDKKVYQDRLLEILRAFNQ
jgi:glycosyltransferase involved in cell wall biosynthesis